MTATLHEGTPSLWRRALIVGLDGFSLHLIRDLLPPDAMPHLTALLERGRAGPLTSVLPTQSAPAWASFFTGQRPGRHGVFDFMVRQPDGSYRHARPPAHVSLWRVLERHGLRTGLFNFPVLFPPSPITGFMVAGMLVPDGAVFTHPPELSARLRQAWPSYATDLKWQLFEGREQALLHELETTVAHRLAAVQDILCSYDVDCLAVAFLSPDRLQHAMWRHLDPQHPDHQPAEAARWQEPIARYYRALDDALARLTRNLEPGTGLILVSDHGFQAAGRQFHIEEWLAQEGWLAYKEQAARWVRLARRLDRPWIQHLRRRLVRDVSRHLTAFAPGGVVDWSRTVATCPWTVQQAIRLNLRGRDPHGIVSPGPEADQLLADIRRALAELRDPDTGQPVIGDIVAGEAYFGETDPSQVPDLAFTLRPGYASSLHRPGLWDRSLWASGDHSLEGFWAVVGPGVDAHTPLFPAQLVDVAPTLYWLLGLPVPAHLDGRPQTELVAPSLRQQAPVRFEDLDAASPDEGPEDSALTEAQEAEIRERLRGLGYL